jgi:hypothetical protein
MERLPNTPYARSSKKVGLSYVLDAVPARDADLTDDCLARLPGGGPASDGALDNRRPSPSLTSG